MFKETVHVYFRLPSLPSTQNWLAPHIHGLLYRSPYANPTITQTSTCEQQKDAGRATQRATWFGPSLVVFLWAKKMTGSTSSHSYIVYILYYIVHTLHIKDAPSSMVYCTI